MGRCRRMSYAEAIAAYNRTRQRSLTQVAATPMATVPTKSEKKGKRQQEDAIEKKSTAKKPKKEVEEAVDKQKSGKKLKASFDTVSKKNPETSCSEDEDISSSESVEEVNVQPKKNKNPRKLLIKISSSEESSSDEEVAVPAKKLRTSVSENGSMTNKTKQSSGSESDSDEDEETKAEVPQPSKKSTVAGAKNGSAAFTRKKQKSSDLRNCSDHDSSSSAEDTVSTNLASCLLAIAHQHLQKTVASHGKKVLLCLQKAVASQGKKLLVPSLKNASSVASKKKCRLGDDSSEPDSADEAARMKDDSEAESSDHTSDEIGKEPQKKKLKVQKPSVTDVSSAEDEDDSSEAMDVSSEEDEDDSPEAVDVSSEEDKDDNSKATDVSSEEDEDDSSKESDDVEPCKKQPEKQGVAAKKNGSFNEESSEKNEDEEHAKSPTKKLADAAEKSGSSDEELSEESEDELPVITPDKKIQTQETPSACQGKHYKTRSSLFDDGDMHFLSDSDEKKYLKSFNQRDVLKGKTVNFDFFEQENLMMIGEWINGLGWKKFLTEKNVVYPELMRQFYAHLNKSMVSYVKGVEINLNQEVLGEILGMDASDDDKEYKNATREVVFKDLIGDEVLAATLQVREMSLPIRLLHVVVVNSILPRKGNKSAVTLDDASVMWCAIKGYKVTLPRAILNHMLAMLSRKNAPLPYGMLITRILEYFKVDLEGEHREKPGRNDVIDQLTLKRMGFKKDEVRGWILKNEPPLAAPQAGQEIAEEDTIQEEEGEVNRADEEALHSPDLNLPQAPIDRSQSSPKPDHTQTVPSTSQPTQTATSQPASQATFPSTFTSDLSQLIMSGLDERLESFESKIMSRIDTLDGRVAVIEHQFATTCSFIKEILKLFEAHDAFITKQILGFRTSLTETTKEVRDGLHLLNEKLAQLKETNALRPQPQRQSFAPVCLTPPHLRKQP